MSLADKALTKAIELGARTTFGEVVMAASERFSRQIFADVPSKPTAFMDNAS